MTEQDPFLSLTRSVLQATSERLQIVYAVKCSIYYTIKQISANYNSCTLLDKPLNRWCISQIYIYIYLLNLRKLNNIRDAFITIADCSSKSQQIPKHLALSFSSPHTRSSIICKQSQGRTKRRLFSGIRVSTLTCKDVLQCE